MADIYVSKPFVKKEEKQEEDAFLDKKENLTKKKDQFLSKKERV